MKKYIGLALVAFFGTALVSLLIAPAAPGTSNQGTSSGGTNNTYRSSGYHAYGVATPPSGTAG